MIKALKKTIKDTKEGFGALWWGFSGQYAKDIDKSIKKIKKR